MKELLLPAIVSLAVFTAACSESHEQSNTTRAEEIVEKALKNANHMKLDDVLIACEKAIKIAPLNSVGYACKGNVIFYAHGNSIGFSKESSDKYIQIPANHWAPKYEAIREWPSVGPELLVAAFAFTDAINLETDNEKLLQWHFIRGVILFSAQRTQGSLTDKVACFDMDKAYAGRNKDAIDWVKDNLQFLRRDGCRKKFRKDGSYKK